MRDPAKILRVLLSQGYSFSFLTPGDVLMHQEFVQRNWPGAKTRGDYNYNKWKYGRNEQGINLLVCKKDGVIIGQIGYVPGRINISGKVYECVWGCNFKVDTAYKEIGIGAALEIYAATIFPVILGNTPSPDSIKYKRSLGYKFIEGPRTMMFPVKSDYLLKLKSPASLKGIIPMAASCINPVLKAYNLIRLAGATGGDWIYGNEDIVAERLKTKEGKIDIPHIVHDKAFINWRCHPPPQYRDKPALMVRKGDEESLAIYAESSGVLNLYDYFFTSKPAFRSFLQYAIKIPGTTTIKVHANTPGEEEMFKSFGFIGFRNKSVITAYSAAGLFQNVEKMHVAIYDGDGDM